MWLFTNFIIMFETIYSFDVIKTILEAHQKISGAHQRSVAHRLRNTDVAYGYELAIACHV